MYVCMCCSMCVCMCAKRPTVALDCVPRGDPRHATAPPIFLYRATQAALPYTGIGLSGHLGRTSGRPWALASPLGLASALGRFEPLDVGYTAQLLSCC